MDEQSSPSRVVSDSRARLTARAICLALSLYACLLLTRGYTMGLSLGSDEPPFDLAGQLIGGAKYDLAIVGFLLGSCLILLCCLNLQDSKLKFISNSYALLVTVTLILAILNITFVKFLGGPLNYQWLYYSDFGMATDVLDALSSVVTWKVLLSLVMGIVTLITISEVLTFIVLRIGSRPVVIRGAALLAFIVVGAAIRIGGPYWSSYSGHQGQIANPIIYFVESWLHKDDAPLLTMKTSVGADDFRIVAERPPMEASDHPIKSSGISNVVIFVMESVAAEYIDTYRGKYGITRNIADRKTHSIQFENIYAHAPTSHKALVSVLSSTYPLISYRTLTKERPDTGFSSMSAELKKYGFRTGFFLSADLRYARVGEFLSHHSFDVVKDFRSIDCDLGWDASATEILRKHSIDDRCTSRAAADWILSDDHHPFFAVVWTNMTHIPYYAAGSETAYVPTDKDFNTYLNALRRGDEALGYLLEALESTGHAGSTLVIITGDHGEAFGQHGQRGHGTSVYEENIHIPLIMMSPALAQREVNDVVGGQIDIAPTVFDILNLPFPPSWQGSSLLATDRPPRTYFFATWTDLQFGYREGKMKFVFDATSNRCRSVDLSNDPGEILNDHVVDADSCEMIRERLAAWMQYQRDLMEKLAHKTY